MALFISFLWSSKDWMGTLYASSRVLGFDWLLYMCPFKFQGLNGYYICGLQSPMVWMVTLFASFGILAIKWVFYMLPLEFQGLNVTIYGSFGIHGLNGSIYASFGVPRTQWLLYMHPLELKGAKFVKCSTKNFYVLQHMGHKPL